ncbi:hypothetical protein WA026_011344 [Henosepilachna vigintioctopunctata]|uniref:Uncharacterized protein n=1 Tax=Henosepilachna vigintioctopunctata TaxID=420089 RepID=A0AAW1TQW8_9CUCU
MGLEGFTNHNYNFAKKIPLGSFGFILSPFRRILNKKQNLTVKKDNPNADLQVTKKLITTTSAPKRVVEESDNVQFLDFTSKGIKSIFELKLSSMKNLKKLILTKNQLKTFKFSDLPFLPQVELIDLSFNPLIEIEWNEFRKFVPKLDIIDITGSKIPDDKIAEYTKVSSCSIVNNKVEKKTPILFPETEN